MTEEQNKTLLQLVARLFPENEKVFEVTLTNPIETHKMHVTRSVIYVNPLTKEDPFRRYSFLIEIYRLRSSRILEVEKPFKTSLYPTITEDKLRDIVNGHTRFVVEKIEDLFIRHTVDSMFPYTAVSDDFAYGFGEDAQASEYKSEECEYDADGFLVVKESARHRRMNEMLTKSMNRK